MIRNLKLKNFTAFKDLELNFSPKLNLIIGANASGKTHILKAIYASVAGFNRAYFTDEAAEQDFISDSNKYISENLINVFKPDNLLGKLKKAPSEQGLKAEVCLHSLAANNQNLEIDYSFNNNSKEVKVIDKKELNRFSTIPNPIFIQSKEIISLMKGFTSLYEKYDLALDQTFYDLCKSLELPEVKDSELNEKSKWVIEKIENLLGGKFIFHGSGKVDFKSTSKQELPASLIAEGYKKLGVLYRLLETGVLVPGSSGTLLWDEPENNLNPQLLKLIAEILIELARNGQQIIIATHDYVLLKWFDLLVDEGKGDEIKFHSLYNDSGDIKVDSQDSFLKLSKNLITDTFVELYEADIEKALG
ncbi:MAG: AAA family ATPase [Cyanobacteria bacterium REEB446]|nr:AAA family ATPase [Cyanobacteria bacterium REEB446]